MKRSYYSKSIFAVFLFLCFFGFAGGVFAVEFDGLYPANNASDVPTNINLLWDIVSGDEELTSEFVFDVYVGLNSFSIVLPIAKNVPVAAYSLQNLAYDETYLWKIVAKSESLGVTITSNINQFTTKIRNAYAFKVSAPKDMSGITDPEEIVESYVGLNQTLKWDFTVDGIDMENITYSVYLGVKGSSQVRVSSGQKQKSFQPTLSNGEMYFWYVKAYSLDGTEWTSPIWCFYTVPEEGGGGCSVGNSMNIIPSILTPLLLTLLFLKKGK